MDLELMSPAHHAHMLAVLAANKSVRMVLLIRKDQEGFASAVVATVVCPRSRKCATCAWELGDKVRVNVGLVQRLLPVEVQRVGRPETTAPAAPHALPEGAGT